MFPHLEIRRLKCSTPIRSLIPAAAAAIFSNPIRFGTSPNRSRFFPVVRDGLAEAPSVAEPEVVFSEIFPLIRTKMVISICGFGFIVFFFQYFVLWMI